MNTTIAYNSPRETCHAVQRTIQSQFPRLVARPWNMYEPETSLWWLVPSNEWPAFKYGKMYFNWCDLQRKRIWAGFHSEKGLDTSVSSVYTSAKASRHIMHDDWHWFDLLRRIADGEFASAVKAVSSELSVPLQLRFSAEYVEHPADFEPYGGLGKRDEYVLQWNSESSEFDLVVSKPEANLLGKLDQIRTFDQLARELNILTSNGWIWVNLNFVIPLPIEDPKDRNERNVWNASDLWSNFLRPFRDFWF
jgi:hypothetical protein